MLVWRLVACLIGCIWSVAGIAQEGASQNSSLPAGSGVVWDCKNGIDYSVCFGVDANTKSRLFGIYTGHAANFKPKDHKRAELGSVSGVYVQWFINEPGHPWSRITAFKVRSTQGTSDYQILVWILANEGAELARAKSVLEAMHLQY
jgi:hypothetical protein